jgi:hypothetical protein
MLRTTLFGKLIGAFALVLLASLATFWKPQASTERGTIAQAPVKENTNKETPVRKDAEPLYDGKPTSYWRQELEEAFGRWSIKPSITLGRN